MRSRYSAYAVGDAGYLVRTWHPRHRPDEVLVDDLTEWTGLSVDEVVAGGADDVGQVTPGLDQGALDDLQAPAGLDLGIGVDGAVGHVRGGAGHGHEVAHPDGAAVADQELPGAPGRDVASAVLHERQRYRHEARTPGTMAP